MVNRGAIMACTVAVLQTDYANINMLFYYNECNMMDATGGAGTS